MYPESFKEEIGSNLYCDIIFSRGQNHHLRKAINNHKNIVISPLGGWDTKDVVHGDGFPWPFNSRKMGV
jgi:hypothetical protein